ncbi:MAG: alkyl hydroperoxide reductase subunit F [Pseudobdellovibrionaceae bacterium]|nr:alkyl hydroperoxide reductase subunit F [Bdellovibrionales bacterium]USN48955.1 MAG: alkyl hydroperoxide reductase subunit F [Pseudobdellovibrionaceae bacterium]
MIDSQMKEQLKAVFAKLKGKIQLIVSESQHAKQSDLLQMLSELAETSPNIEVVKTTELSPSPGVRLTHNGQDTGVAFRGVPSGHEFTSLVLSVLNADGLGKWPDEMLLNRVKSLKGPVDIKTFISLTCENCPDVVQALNQMALVHPDFRHEMVDGGVATEDVEKLKIQAVPTVVAGDKAISVGKAGFLELLEILEETFGTDKQQISTPKDLGHYDVAVIGAGPAGVSAAIYSARKGLKTVVLAERVGGQVQDTKGIENLISVPYTEGPQLSAQMAKHMAEYEIQVLEHRRVEKMEAGETRKISLTSGEFLDARSVIVATGAKWRELGVPGEKDYLGRGVAYCPHCDGPFYKGKRVAVVGGGNSGVEAAIDLAGIVKSVVMVEFGEKLKADEVLVKKLKSLPNVDIITMARTTEVRGDGDKVVGLSYEDRSTEEIKLIDLDGVFVQIGLIPNSGFLKGVVELTKYGEIIVDEKCRTNVEGVYAAGDVTTVPYKQIVISMGEGAKAALAAFEDQMVL